MRRFKYFRFLKLVFIIMLMTSCVKMDRGIIVSFYNFPNPFHPENEPTKFRLIFDTTDISSFDWKLVIYAEDSSSVYEASGSVSTVSSPLDIIWNGRDNRGNIVRNGIYKAWLTLKITKTAAGYSGNIYQTSCYVVVK